MLVQNCQTLFKLIYCFILLFSYCFIPLLSYCFIILLYSVLFFERTHILAENYYSPGVANI